MKILMLNYEFPPIGGGAANANLCLLKEYAKRGDLSVDVLTSGPEPGFFEEDFSDNVWSVGAVTIWRMRSSAFRRVICVGGRRGSFRI